MGDDFSNIQIYTSANQPDAVHTSLIAAIPILLKTDNYERVRSFRRCDRVIAASPAGNEPWITLYDSAAYWTDYDLIESREDTKTLALKLSEMIGPVVTIDMSDSAVMQLHLLIQGTQVDQYSDRFTLFEQWRDEAHKAEWGGKEHLWVKHLKLPEISGVALRATWDMRDDEYYLQYDLQDRLVEILGWDEDLCWGGYTLGMDGIPILYSDSENSKKKGFTELYFRKRGKSM